MGFQWIEAVSIFVEIFLCYKVLNLLFINEYFNDRKERILQNLLAVSFAVLFSVFQYVQGKDSFVGVTQNWKLAGMVFLTAVWVYNARKLAVLSVIMLYFVLHAIMEIGGILFLSAILQKESSLSALIGEYTTGRAVCYIFMNMIWILLYLCLLKVQKSREKNGVEKYTIWILLFSAAGFGVVYYFYSTAFLSITYSLIRSWTFVMLLLFMIAALGWIYKKYRDAQETTHMMEVKNLLLERNYGDMEDIYSEASRNFHDMKNHWNTVYRMIKSDQKEAALQYMEQVVEPFRRMEDTVWTKHKMIDLILNSKRGEMNEEQIQIEMDTEILPKIPVQDFEMCTILANLLDNALDACRKIPQGKDRWIRISIKVRNQMLFLKISNSLEVIPVLKGGRMITTKDRKKLHGFGMENVRQTVQKYDGCFTCQFDDTHFDALVSIPI